MSLETGPNLLQMREAASNKKNQAVAGLAINTRLIDHHLSLHTICLSCLR